MLSRARARNPPPASRAGCEHIRVARQSAATVAPADHVEPAVRDRRSRRGAAVGQRRELAPGAMVEHEGPSRRLPVGCIAADHVHAPIRACGCRVIEGDRQVLEPPPTVRRGNVGVGASGAVPVADESADHDDLVADGSRRDLAARLRHRCVTRPPRSAPSGGKSEQAGCQRDRPEPRLDERAAQGLGHGPPEVT